MSTSIQDLALGLKTWSQNHWFLAFVALYSLYYVASALYQIFLSPLRRYPGPFLARFSEAWSMYYTMDGKGRCHALLDAHRRYNSKTISSSRSYSVADTVLWLGDTIRVGPNELHFSNPDMTQQIYREKEVVKDPSFYRNGNIIGFNNIFSFSMSSHLFWVRV